MGTVVYDEKAMQNKFELRVNLCEDEVHHADGCTITNHIETRSVTRFLVESASTTSINNIHCNSYIVINCEMEPVLLVKSIIHASDC